MQQQERLSELRKQKLAEEQIVGKRAKVGAALLVVVAVSAA